MENGQFDRWTRAISQTGSRRAALKILAATFTVLATAKRAHAQEAGPGTMCGGFAALPCPDGFTCVDDAGDDCDPETGGADCSGVCVPIDVNPCAAMLCIEGTVCCPNCGGICVPGDIPCSDELCVGEPCNQAVCGPGDYCCNESCSRCVPLEQGCTRELCPPGQPSGERCGRYRCAAGEYCCNPSCGICAPLGGGCIEIYCEVPDEIGVPCGPTVCPPGQVCCNESCGICTPPDGVCIALFCTG